MSIKKIRSGIKSRTAWQTVILCWRRSQLLYETSRTVY